MTEIDILIATSPRGLVRRILPVAFPPLSESAGIGNKLKAQSYSHSYLEYEIGLPSFAFYHT